LKAKPEENESVAEHQEVPKEDSLVKPVKGRKKQHRGRKLAAGRCGEPKELTRGECGCRRKLAAACRKVSRRAAVARRKGNVFRKIRTQENCGPCKELAVARSQMTHRSKVPLAGDMIARNTTKTVRYEKPGKNGRSGRDVGKAQNATMA
jgi:hypothetical protein